MSDRTQLGPFVAIRRESHYDVALAVSPTTLIGQVLVESDSNGTTYTAFASTPAGMLGDPVPQESLGDAVADLERRYLTARRVARAVRAIRPATGASVSGLDATWDEGYNQALRDVEAVLRDLTGPAPEGEGYTAITRP